MFKLIAMDLDGTLLNSKMAVSPENAQAIAQAGKKGLKVVIATGRPPVGTRQAQTGLGHHHLDYLITYNGALTENVRTGETIALHTVRVADYLDVADFAHSCGLFCYCFTRTSCLTPAWHDTPASEGKINGIDVLLTDFAALPPATPLVKIMVTGDPAELDRCRLALPADWAGRFVIARSAPILLEFMHPQASKGQAVQTLAERLGIRREEIICFGDSGNDIDMIRYAGLGVAMANATAEIRQSADFITLTCDDHGVAHGLRQFI